MGEKLERFFAGSSKQLRLGSLGFAIAGAGAAVGFSIDYGPSNPLAYVALAMVAIGIAIGLVAVGWGWYSLFRRPE